MSIRRETGCVFCTHPAVCDGWINDAEVVHFEPLNPVVPGHRLFVPTYHVEHAGEEPHITALVMRAAAEWGQRQEDAFNLITSAGSAATQTVRHLHIHYVPRHLGDGLHLPWTGQIIEGEKMHNSTPDRKIAQVEIETEGSDFTVYGEDLEAVVHDMDSGLVHLTVKAKSVKVAYE